MRLEHARYWHGLWAITGLCAAAGPSPAAVMPTPVLDQAQESRGGGGYVTRDRNVAQTFVPGVSGRLTSIDVFVDWWQGPAYSLRVQVTGTAGGKPDDRVLGSAPITTHFGWTPVPLGDLSDIRLEAGTMYALWFTSDDPSVDDPGIGVGANWRPDRYANGQALVRDSGEDWKPWNVSTATGPTGDVMFRTYMAVPEPAGPVLCAAAAGMLLRRRRREQ